MDTGEFLSRACVEPEALQSWIEAGWLLPEQHRGAWRFSEIDLSRAQLIRDLREDLGVNDEGVPVVLDLLDQLYGVRRAFRDLVSAISAQPQSLRQQIVAEIRTTTFETRSQAPSAARRRKRPSAE